jgi:hypothetical protein
MRRPDWLLAGVLALDMVRLTGLSHEKIDINPSNVASVRAPPPERQGHFHMAVRCVIYTADGKFIPVLEECDVVRKLLNAAR